MTQKTKLEILGPYMPEHEGPFCTRDGRTVDLKILDGRGVYSLIGYIGDEETLITWQPDGIYMQAGETPFDLMCAREVPVPQEFWVNEYHGGNRVVYDSPEKAQEFQVCLKRTIHMIEVLPGEGA